MTKKQLFELLNKLPDDAEICALGSSRDDAFSAGLRIYTKGDNAPLIVFEPVSGDHHNVPFNPRNKLHE